MIKNILAVLAVLLKRIDQWAREQERKRHEREVKELRDDPAGWFDGHFNGDRDRVSDKPADAADPDKAGASEPDDDPGRRDNTKP